jgi:4-amino-4-deoxy-L-arabinose transferase-like glycosyltransferase
MEGVLLVVLLAIGVVSAVYLNLTWLGVSAAAAAAAATLALLLATSERFARVVQAGRNRVEAALDHGTTKQFLTVAILAGLLLRVVWVALVAPVQQSDMGAYFGLASQLAAGTDYRMGSDIAFWPPGLPFVLAFTMLATGLHAWAPTFNNLCLFAGSVVLLHALAARLTTARAARVAVALVVVWPNWIVLSGLAAKELLLIVLFIASAVVYLRYAASGQRPVLGALAAGALLGFATLTQPSVLLLPPLMFGSYELLVHRKVRQAVGRAALIAAAMVLVVAPWTVRNYLVLGEFIPVATTGGGVLWVANNSDATGSWVPFPQRLIALDEVSRDRAARAEAVSWIRAHPTRFASLSVRKAMLFWADDSKGAYEAMRRGSTGSNRAYTVVKGVSNMFWVSLLVVALLTAVPRSALIILLPIAYFVLLHSVFESDGRFHTPLMGFFAILAAIPAVRADRTAS